MRPHVGKVWHQAPTLTVLRRKYQPVCRMAQGPCRACKGLGHRRAGKRLSLVTVWTCLVSFSVIRCLIAPLGPVDACAAVIMIYSRVAVWGSLLLASSVSLDVWAAGFSAQFVNDEIQQAASATPRKQGRMMGPHPQAVSEKGWAPLKHGGLGAWGMGWRGRGCGKTG